MEKNPLSGGWMGPLVEGVSLLREDKEYSYHSEKYSYHSEEYSYQE